MSTRAVPARPRRAPLLFALLGALACSGSEDESEDTQPPAVSPEVSACISSHPPGEPFDLGADGSSTPTLETLADECRTLGGSGCEERFISLEAARCIAQDARFALGLDEWVLSLSYDISYRRVVWGVQNVLVDTSTSYSGESLSIDAVSGGVLGQANWVVSGGR